MDTTAVVVTHQSARVLESCLVRLAELPGLSVLVVDNASTDGSREIAAARGILVLASGANSGFAAAANRGGRAAGSRLLCFLNPDCLLTAETLDAARAALAHRPLACAVPDFEQGGAVLPGRQPGYTWRKVLADLMENNRRFPGVLRRLRAHAAHHDTTWHWPLGTCLFVPAPLFQGLGGFDERYFLYMEDVEFGWRLNRRGGEVVSLSTRVAHGGMQGADVAPGLRRRLLNAARVQFARRHYGVLAGWVARGLARP